MCVTRQEKAAHKRQQSVPAPGVAQKYELDSLTSNQRLLAPENAIKMTGNHSQSSLRVKSTTAVSALTTHVLRSVKERLSGRRKEGVAYMSLPNVPAAIGMSSIERCCMCAKKELSAIATAACTPHHITFALQIHTAKHTQRRRQWWFGTSFSLNCT